MIENEVAWPRWKRRIREGEAPPRLRETHPRGDSMVTQRKTA